MRDDTFVICGPNDAFDDGHSIRGECARCSTAIVWRDHSPEPSVKVCLPCAMKEGLTLAVITEETAKEVAAYLLAHCHGGKES